MASILERIANPVIADVGGAFRAGRANREERERREQTQLLAGDIVANQLGTQFAELSKIDASAAVGLADALGIPKNSQDRLKNAAGTISYANKLLQGGSDPRAVGQLIAEQAQQLGRAGLDVSQMMELSSDLISGDPQKIKRQTDALFQLNESIEGPKDRQKQTNVLRKNVSDVTKDLKKVDAAFRKIKKAGSKSTAAGDMSLIFSFMKILDPGSTVREGEFATAQQATGIPGQVVNLYNRALEGTRLNDAQRADFIGQSESLFEAERESADLSIGNILQQADQDEISRVKVLGRRRLTAFEERSSRPEEVPREISQTQMSELMQRRPDLTEAQIRGLLK